jgi:hypothetical protein
MATSRRQTLDRVRQFLEEATAEPVEEASLPAGEAVDLVLRAGSNVFLVQAKQSSSAASVVMAARQLHAVVAASSATPDSLQVAPLLVVPYMGEVGRRICKDEGISWCDLSGNADITALGLRVLITGHENQFKRRGRRSTPFAPQASRVARQFLIGDRPRYSQKELVERTGLDQGFVSRILRRLEEDGLVTRENRLFESPNRSLLLDAWSEVYDFTKHRILKGHVAARSSEDLLSAMSDTLERERQVYAATGLAGAWLFTRFASFRLATFYVEEEPSSSLLDELGFREDPKGANVWLVVPNDEGVFTGREEQDGIWCAHPVQVYLDLKFHPERSAEAAERLRETYLSGEDHGSTS